MIKLGLYTVVFFFLSCSTGSRGKLGPLELGQQQAYDEIHLEKAWANSIHKNKTLAKKHKSLNTNFSLLRGSFDVLVFEKMQRYEKEAIANFKQKINDKNLKDTRSEDLLRSVNGYGVAEVYRFSTKKIQRCSSFIGTNSHLTEVFGRSRKEKGHKELQCGIINVRHLRGKSRGKKKVKNITLYLDENYQLYGQDIVLKEQGKHKKTQVIFAENGHSFSLDNFPINLPSLSSGVVLESWRFVFSDVRNVPRDSYVKLELDKKLDRKVRASLCDSGVSMNYQDLYGDKVAAHWCPGHSWPTIIESNKYYAHLIRGHIRGK